MGSELFKKVASVNRLKKRNCKKPDKVLKTYSREIFTLDGQMELDISFGDKTMKTTIYIKLDAYDQLLLSEGVCRQLGIIIYHPDVHPSRVKKVDDSKNDNQGDEERDGTVIPLVRVHLIERVRLLPQQCSRIQVHSEGGYRNDCDGA